MTPVEVVAEVMVAVVAVEEAWEVAVTVTTPEVVMVVGEVLVEVAVSQCPTGSTDRARDAGVEVPML